MAGVYAAGRARACYPRGLDEPGSPTARNYALTVEYDGRGFLGWQRHGDRPTVQGALESAITKAFGVHAVVSGSGRTDRGAHARGQVASVRLPQTLAPVEAIAAINAGLPAGVLVVAFWAVDESFHARDSAVAKTYHYAIWNEAQLPKVHEGRVWHVPGRLDVDAMRAACPVFVGEHDFASFATRPNFARQSTRRTVMSLSLVEDRPRLTFHIRADGFLYKMVRNIVRALVKVGEGRYDAARLQTILDARDRHAAPGTAPASGLCLHLVEYADDVPPVVI
jgi:tRNA pseudouridine38-40 synthase